jgi:hypothetical protein
LKEIKKCLFLRLSHTVQPEEQTFSNSTGNGIEIKGDRERTTAPARQEIETSRHRPPNAGWFERRAIRTVSSDSDGTFSSSREPLKVVPGSKTGLKRLSYRTSVDLASPMVTARIRGFPLWAGPAEFAEKPASQLSFLNANVTTVEADGAVCLA